jgi:hypothetical protein
MELSPVGRPFKNTECQRSGRGAGKKMEEKMAAVTEISTNLSSCTWTRNRLVNFGA